MTRIDKACAFIAISTLVGLAIFLNDVFVVPHIGHAWKVVPFLDLRSATSQGDQWMDSFFSGAHSHRAMKLSDCTSYGPHTECLEREDRL